MEEDITVHQFGIVTLQLLTGTGGQWPVATILDNTTVTHAKDLNMGLEQRWSDKRDGRNFWTSEAVEIFLLECLKLNQISKNQTPRFLEILTVSWCIPLDARCSNEDQKSDFHEDKTGES
ncbi:hypothetical protein STEG23_013937 [Scotinomys teguina]